MFRIPNTFISSNEDYLTLIPIKEFIKNNPQAEVKKDANRAQQLTLIETYANRNEAAQEIVEEWIDRSIMAGRKEVYLKELENNPIQVGILKERENIERIISGNIKEHRHICNNTYTPDYSICKYDIDEGDFGKVIKIILCKLIYSFDSKEEKSIQWYPVVVNVYLDKGYIEARAKQKTHMFKYERIDNVEEMKGLEALTPEKEAREAIGIVCSVLELQTISNHYTSAEHIKQKIYNLLEQSIGTHDEIKTKLDENERNIESIVEYYNQNIYNLSEPLKNDLKDDIKNVFEKYMSITRNDTNIFVSDRKIYPIRLIASDEDTSKVDQTSAAKAPLQSKPIFYNNKSMIFKNKKCDGIMFSIEKENATTKRNRYCANIVERKGFGVISWQEYLKEDDINYVLHRFINA